jgi:hypothetical protein
MTLLNTGKSSSRKRNTHGVQRKSASGEGLQFLLPLVRFTFIRIQETATHTRNHWHFSATDEMSKTKPAAAFKAASLPFISYVMYNLYVKLINTHFSEEHKTTTATL